MEEGLDHIFAACDVVEEREPVNLMAKLAVRKEARQAKKAGRNKRGIGEAVGTAGDPASTPQEQHTSKVAAVGDRMIDAGA